MKKVFLLSIFIVSCYGCSTLFPAGYGMGMYESELIDVVAFDTDCPKEKIRVLEKDNKMGSGNYKVEACGKEYKYKRTGSIFHAADKSPI